MGESLGNFGTEENGNAMPQCTCVDVPISLEQRSMCSEFRWRCTSQGFVFHHPLCTKWNNVTNTQQEMH